jgi:hypothetical protein
VFKEAVTVPHRQRKSVALRHRGNRQRREHQSGAQEFREREKEWARENTQPAEAVVKKKNNAVIDNSNLKRIISSQHVALF